MTTTTIRVPHEVAKALKLEVDRLQSLNLDSNPLRSRLVGKIIDRGLREIARESMIK